MACKIFVNYSGHVLNKEKSDLLAKRVADALCVCPEDVIVLGDVQSISVVEVPDSMTKAREKQNVKEVKESTEPKGPHETHYPKISKEK